MAGKVWFVTGSSRGLGRAIVQAALQAGDRVVATARRPGQLADLAAEHGQSIAEAAATVLAGRDAAWREVSRSTDRDDATAAELDPLGIATLPG
jgi:NAD(P)-dependent dehydrogenase (short-subunit alcohol dehydrogenase family)